MEHLRNAFKTENKLEILKKKEFDIYYSCSYKYPLLVIENINGKTGKTDGEPFGRFDPELKNPWKMDSKLPKECRLKVQNYRDYMEYGGSNGHNAPASFHKTTKEIYLETYKLSNCSPQEIVFNGGLWNLLENWCKNLQKESYLENIMVFTGNIPDKKNYTFNTTTLNVPTHMFKIITANHKSKPNQLYIACFLMENKRPSERIYKLYKYLVNIKEISKLANINFNQIFKEYSNLEKGKTIIKGLKQLVRIDIHLNRFLIKSVDKAHMFGDLIYSQNLDELKRNWQICKAKGYDDEYHELSYKLARKRLKRDENNKEIHPLLLKNMINNVKNNNYTLRNIKNNIKNNVKKTKKKIHF